MGHVLVVGVKLTKLKAAVELKFNKSMVFEVSRSGLRMIARSGNIKNNKKYWVHVKLLQK